MSSIKTRLHNARAKLLRRSSATSTATRSLASSAGSERDGPLRPPSTRLRKSASLSRLPEASAAELDVDHEDDPRLVQSEVLRGTAADRADVEDQRAQQPSATAAATATASPSATLQQHHHHHHHPEPARAEPPSCPELTLEAPTPIHPDVVKPAALAPSPAPSSAATSEASDAGRPSEPSPHASSRSTPPAAHHAHTDARPVTTLLAPDHPPPPPAQDDYFGGAPVPVHAHALSQQPRAMHRKIWVKRPNASATLVQIREDDLVDDVRDMILKKYANSLGRSFDAPDVTLRIVPRDAARAQDRTLGPEEDMCRTIDAVYPGGQTVNEALLIDVPQRLAPKLSPRVPAYYSYHDDATHHQTEYFPPMPAVVNPSPAAMSASQHDPRGPLPHAHSIAVLSTGQLPALPSPGGTRRALLHSGRPRNPRHNTASPTTIAGGIPSSATSARPLNRPRHDSSASDTKHSATSNNPIPTPPVAADPAAIRQTSNPPTPRIASPQPNSTKKRRKKVPEPSSLPAGLLDGSVPPINVLIVEDNIINLRVLGAFMQRLKVRWQRAMNGKEAVTKWKAGGFHLVLMDIQLPVMNGLEATKEIRRLERVNSIGVFSSGTSEAPNNRLGQDGNGPEEPQEDDRLGDKGLFKSPVIIVALTASSLQSDRHEALAAGCNDFLTKVSYIVPSIH
jgi:osomolarity two-component system response regulator SSK1